MAVGETLKLFSQSLCGKCMDLHAVSHACHHPNGLVYFSKGSEEMSGYIVGISKSSNKELETEISEALVLDVELMDHIFKVPITTVKRIPHGCRLVFSQALKVSLYKVVAQPDYVDAWVRLLLFPRCTLQVYRPKNRQERRVRVSGGAEAILHSVNRALSEYHNDGSLAMLTVDFSNAFNLVDRSALLHETVASFFFMLGLIDGGVIGDSEEVARVLDIIKRPSSGVKLLEGAVSKDADFISGLALRRAVNSVDLMSLLPQLHDPQSELLLLRSCMVIAKLFFSLRICQPIYMEVTILFFDKGLRGSIENIVVAMKGVGKEMSKYLSDFQFRVRVSGGAEAILHSVNRALSEYHNDGSLAMLNVDFSNAFNLVDRSALLHETVASFFFMLGLIDGGVIGDSEEVARVLDIIKVSGPASRAQSWVPQDHILRNSGICGMDDDYVSALALLRDTIPSFNFSGFTNKDIKAVFECLCTPHAHDFLLAIPIDGLGQYMSPVEYRTILKYRLMIPLFSVDAICSFCRKACLDSFEKHAIHCKELPGFKYRHDMVRDVIFDICRRAGIFAKKEAPVNFLTDPSDGRSTLRPADILFF
nr:hypothetical protein [Tanacetum cinerariifolium]